MVVSQSSALASALQGRKEGCVELNGSGVVMREVWKYNYSRHMEGDIAGGH